MKNEELSVNRLLMICVLLTLTVQTVWGQQRLSCTPHSQKAGTRGSYILKEPLTSWDATHTYRQPVVLITFKDCDFSMADPVAYYRRVLNEKGYNEGVGKGCVADYFREQSGGLFNVQFDIYGPFQVDTTAIGGEENYGDYPKGKALEQLRNSTDADFSIYDWNGNGKVDQVVFIAAGYTGNESPGYIWPNTGPTYYKAPGNLAIEDATISCEKWKNDKPCGIGTIIHEFSHCLGLPDIYPLGDNMAYSAVDEWDLMDGGNYTNYGWCPPNLSVMEKMHLGWATPTELTTATTISGMKPVSEGGETFIIRNSGYRDEFYLLENRRQTGWDCAAPGNGLLIFHVDYNYRNWCNNRVNMSNDHYRYSLIAADNKTYKDWDPKNDGSDPNKWTMADRMRNRYLSTVTYPYIDSTMVVHANLTDATVPAATLFNANADNTKFMSKPISNIRVDNDGIVSFDFMKVPSGIREVPLVSPDSDAWYDLQGRRLQGKPTRKGVYIYGIKKVILR